MTKSIKSEPLTPRQWDKIVGFGTPDRQDEFPLTPIMKAAASVTATQVERVSRKLRPWTERDLANEGCAGLFTSGPKQS